MSQIDTYRTSITLVSNSNNGKLTNKKYPQPKKKEKKPPANIYVIEKDRQVIKRNVYLPTSIHGATDNFILSSLLQTPIKTKIVPKSRSSKQTIKKSPSLAKPQPKIQITNYPPFAAEYDYVYIGKNKIPASPFIWYREQHLLCPLEKIIKLNKQKMSVVLKKYNASIQDDADDYFVVIQRNILKNSNLYLSYHGYLYVKDRDQEYIPANFNKNYVYISKCISLNNGVLYTGGQHNYKKNKYITGNVYIHDGALSPANHFKFKVKDEMGYVILLTHGHSTKMDNVSCVCLFILINDHNRKKNNGANILKYFERF